MEGFRVVCDLSEILDGIRKRSFLYVDIDHLCTIRDLCFRIKASFNIKENIGLMIDEVYLPFCENIKILRSDDVIKVFLLNSGNAETTSQNIDPDHLNGNGVGNGLPQRSEDIIQASGETTENVNIPRKRKRKRQTNVCENSNENDTQELTEVTSDNPEVMGLEMQHPKKNKRKRRQKRRDIKPDEENAVQGLTDVVSVEIRQSTEVPTGESIAAIPTSESIAVIPTGDPDPSSVSRKRKRIRARKRKTAASNTPSESYTETLIRTQYSCEPALNPYAKSFANQDPNLSHIRFSPSTASNEVKDEFLDYDPIEDDLLVQHRTSVQEKSSVEKDGSEINGINSSLSKIVAPGNGTPLVVRRAARIDSVQSPAANVPKFLQKPPEINDIITFKIWKMDQNYCPQISGQIKAKVLNFCNDTKQVRFFILDGKSHCEQPSGKFSLEADFTDDGPLVPPIIPDIMELNWQEMLEVEIFL